MEGQLALTMFIVVCGILLLGFPVALTLGGTALGFAALGILIGHFDPDYLTALTGRIFGTMSNETLVAVPLFILMGVVLERAKIAEDLLANMAGLFGERPGGLGVAVICRRITGGEHRHCRRHGRDHGGARAPLHAESGVSAATGNRHHLRHWHLGSDYSAIDCARFAG
ncbi:MAG: hypothetical protein CM15mP25_1760 [Gammaproteobacteria bacterium]|nr:MAG: hypothetical protein CM15mP25_1760 [Gammaproteobacteria bacterium]